MNSFYLWLGISMIVVGLNLGAVAIYLYRRSNYRPRRVRSTWID
jgi:hypothetical protein